MKSQYLQKLELLDDAGYFKGLPPEKFYDVLKDNYERSNEEKKKLMDENSDLYLDSYKNGIVQTNLIYQKINGVHKILVFYLILTIISLIVFFYDFL